MCTHSHRMMYYLYCYQLYLLHISNISTEQHSNFYCPHVQLTDLLSAFINTITMSRYISTTKHRALSSFSS
uniref:Uncharacterized protein n=1 Tax=Octopus bimaculoides TaxID=37653 RepID=A0A0L8GAE6_OCTBM